MLPSMWRSELLHPLTVHFPIALLIVGSLFYVLSVFFGRHLFFRNLRKFSYMLIIVGTVFAWIAIYTGDLAEHIVSSNLCDPSIKETHEDFAYYVAYLFTTFSIFHIFSETLSPKLSAFFLWFNVFLAIAGSGAIGYVGHLGATLTYQQSAGVYNPGAECKGFE
jgi:uncharacterized membrane protein